MFGRNYRVQKPAFWLFSIQKLLILPGSFSKTPIR